MRSLFRLGCGALQGEIAMMNQSILAFNDRPIPYLTDDGAFASLLPLAILDHKIDRAELAL